MANNAFGQGIWSGLGGLSDLMGQSALSVLAAQQMARPSAEELYRQYVGESAAYKRSLTFREELQKEIDEWLK